MLYMMTFEDKKNHFRQPVFIGCESQAVELNYLAQHPKSPVKVSAIRTVADVYVQRHVEQRCDADTAWLDSTLQKLQALRHDIFIENGWDPRTSLDDV